MKEKKNKHQSAIPKVTTTTKKSPVMKDNES